MGNAPADASGTIRVLLCDDVEALRVLLRIVIELEPGLSVVGEAGDGNEAVDQARELQPDVILLDLSMPRRTGLHALPDIRDAAPNASVIALTGLSEDVVGDAARKAGATYFLQKGAETDVIIAAIKGSGRVNGRAPTG